ncbi:MAG: isoaspartyl peptidase/L-asparaginase [Alphaproteobacteria bacterium]|nr:isoaspartyl peptidase/L-asparaginase [Alphaproteobacteria bacterium]
MTDPRLMIHGGLGPAAGFARGKHQERAALQRIAEDSFVFLRHHTALETVIHAVSLLEDDPLFNAGTGSKLQSDGVIRMTASVMDGARQRFAGVINIRDVKNPVQVAARLLEYDDRVLAGEEATAFARGQGFSAHNPETAARRTAYDEQHKGGTVGCVALDAAGRLAAATSTGGKGFEMPGRVSDSSTVAGNYANAVAAVSCTGIGEDIVNSALAARIVIRVTDGMTLDAASAAAVAELAAQRGEAGFIALDAQGHMQQAATHPYLAYATHDGRLRVF